MQSLLPLHFEILLRYSARASELSRINGNDLFGNGKCSKNAAQSLYWGWAPSLNPWMDRTNISLQSCTLKCTREVQGHDMLENRRSFKLEQQQLLILKNYSKRLDTRRNPITWNEMWVLWWMRWVSGVLIIKRAGMQIKCGNSCKATISARNK